MTPSPTEPGPPPGLAPWRAARTFEDLLALAGRFVAGDLDAFPGWGGRDLDEESDGLAPLLAALHRAGVLTVASQPGRPFGPAHDGRDWAGRAFVGGFAEPERAAALAAAARDGGLLTLVAPPGAAAPTAELVAGLRDGVPYLVLGGDAGEHEREIFAEHAGPAAAAALADRTFLWLVEPSWGRRERFTATLRAASERVARTGVESARDDPGQG